MPESPETSSRPHQAPVRIRLEADPQFSAARSSENAGITNAAIPPTLAAELAAEFGQSTLEADQSDSAGPDAQSFDDEIDAFIHTHVPLLGATAELEEPEETPAGSLASAAVDEKFPWLAAAEAVTAADPSRTNEADPPAPAAPAETFDREPARSVEPATQNAVPDAPALSPWAPASAASNDQAAPAKSVPAEQDPPATLPEQFVAKAGSQASKAAETSQGAGAPSPWAPNAANEEAVPSQSAPSAEAIPSVEMPRNAPSSLLEPQATIAEEKSKGEEDRMSPVTSDGAPDAKADGPETIEGVAKPAADTNSELPPFDLALGMQRNKPGDDAAVADEHTKPSLADVFAKLRSGHLEKPHLPKGGFKAPSLTLPPAIGALIEKIPPKLRLVVLGVVVVLLAVIVGVLTLHHGGAAKPLPRAGMHSVTKTPVAIDGALKTPVAVEAGAKAPVAVPVTGTQSEAMPPVAMKPAKAPIHKAANHHTTIVQANTAIVPDGTVLTPAETKALKKSLPATCGVHGEKVSRWSFHGGFLLCTVSAEEGMGAYVLERDTTGYTYLGGLTEAPSPEGLVDLGVPLEDGKYLLAHLKKL